MHRLIPAAVLLAGAAACFQPATPASPVTPGPDAGTVLAPESAQAVSVEFGAVPVGQLAERFVSVRNDGASNLDVLKARRGAVFDTSFSTAMQPFTLAPGEERQVLVAFRPTDTGVRLADFELPVSDSTLRQLVVHAKGTGVNPSCVVEPNVAFGTLVTGESLERSVRIENTSELPWTVTVSPIDGAGAFSFGAGFSSGVHTVAAHASLSIPINFAPRTTGDAQAKLPVAAPMDCGAVEIALSGAAVESALTWEPQSQVTFGYRNLGERLVRTLRIKNRTDRPRSLSNLDVSESAGDAFRLDTLERGHLITGGDSWDLPLVFQPHALGELRGALSFATDAPGQSSATVALIGFGGGPDIAATAAIDFGEVATSGFVVKSVEIKNRGTDTPGTTDDDLKFGAFDANAQWQVRAPEITGATGEFSLQNLAAPPALAAGRTTTIRVKFAPTSPGTKAATLTLFTNDPDQPTVAIPLRGEAVSMPPCDLVVRPSGDFGTVPPNTTLTLPFQIANVGAAECLVSALELNEGTPPEFTLVNGPVASTRIARGTSMTVRIRFAPNAAGKFVGAMTVFSSGAPRQLTLALSGTSAPTCLALSPSPLEFGPIPASCASIERTITVTNNCATTRTLDSIDLLGLSPEITITQKPAMPASLASYASAAIKLRYRPSSAGDDADVVAVQAGQERRLVPLSGTGVALATRTDEFVQSQFTATDMLVIYDVSASMANKQVQLGIAWNALIQAARASSSDFHIGVTSPLVDPGPNSTAVNGRLLPLAGPTRVWTRANIDTMSSASFGTPSGTGGSTMLIRPAYLALSPPLVTNENAGFLRPFANLAVVVISDANDPDTVPIATYQSFFASLKSFGRVTVSGIVPTLATAPSGCSYDSQPGDRTRMASLVAATGGVLYEVCSTDWLPAIDRIARLAFPNEFRFPLSSAPDMSAQPDPIRVTVGGQPLPAVNASGDLQWRFDPTSNEIVFRVDIAPPAFSRIAVSYRVACLP